jgi:NADP-reducing hydrogenase subunit HndD
MEEKQITLQIDGHFITVPEGSTILEAACKIGINIPTLCHIDLKGTCIKNNPASCRICVVEVAGRRNLAPACATRCTEGMVVKTSTLRVMNARKVVAELILSDHPNDCLTCPKCGNCELQTLALRFNIREMPFNGGELSPRKREVTSSIVRNMDKCIFCRRCESVCNDVQTVGALGAIRRGFNTTIAPAFDRMMKDSECTYCGQCVAVCPVGALTERDYTNRLLDDLADPDKIVIVPRRTCRPGRRIRLASRHTGNRKNGLRPPRTGFRLCIRYRLCRRPHHHGRRFRNPEPTDTLSGRR